MDSTVQSITQGKIPQDFWNTDAFANKPNLKYIHEMVVERLQIESPDADTLELMMMERVCFLYVYMRAGEVVSEDGTVAFDRAYKDMMSLWVSMAADLRKQRLRLEETQGIRMAIVSEVSKAIKEALKDVDPDVSKEVQLKLVSLVG